MKFESANPSVVRSIKQRVLLNAWLRARHEPASLPSVADFKPDGLAEELADMMTFDVEGAGESARFFITQEGWRLAAAYGTDGLNPAARINRQSRDTLRLCAPPRGRLPSHLCRRTFRRTPTSSAKLRHAGRSALNLTSALPHGLTL